MIGMKKQHLGMNNEQVEENSFWYWKKEISPEICQKIIDLGKGKWSEAQTGGPIQNNTSPANIRKSDVVWVNEQWIFDLIWGYMLSANKNAGWKYNITAVESCQITRYTKDGFYTWHKDGMGSHNRIWNEPDNKFLHENTRKLSMSIGLNTSYKGGNFKMRGVDRGLPKVDEGTIVVFPSFLDHKVTPVTEGTRYSLVSWFVGPPFE